MDWNPIHLWERLSTPEKIAVGIGLVGIAIFAYITYNKNKGSSASSSANAATSSNVTTNGATAGGLSSLLGGLGFDGSTTGAETTGGNSLPGVNAPVNGATTISQLISALGNDGSTGGPSASTTTAPSTTPAAPAASTPPLTTTAPPASTPTANPATPNGTNLVALKSEAIVDWQRHTGETWTGPIGSYPAGWLAGGDVAGAAQKTGPSSVKWIIPLDSGSGSGLRIGSNGSGAGPGLTAHAHAPMQSNFAPAPVPSNTQRYATMRRG